MKRFFWMAVGAGLGLWGRDRAKQAYDSRVPKPVQRLMHRHAVARVVRFWSDVRREERRRTLQRELNDLDHQV